MQMPLATATADAAAWSPGSVPLGLFDSSSSGHAGRVLLVQLGPPTPTPWGPAGAFILCVLPIAFLLVVTVVKRLLLPTSISLPVAAAMLAFIRLAYLSSPAVLVCAACVSGVLEALTPLSIITGAIMLFQSMQHTKCLPWMMSQIKSLSAGHPVGEIFLVGFAFAYLVEGASGFGTPVALAAPMLASLGHDPLLTVVCLLVMNTFATQFGAVGTPIWFGFGDIGLGEANLQLTGMKAAIIVGLCTFLLAPLAASFLTPFKVLARNSLFVVLSIATAVGPSIAISMFSYEFPTLIGGLASVLLTAVLVKFKIGLRPVEPTDFDEASCGGVLAAAGGGGGGGGGSMLGRRGGSTRSVSAPAWLHQPGSDNASVSAGSGTRRRSAVQLSQRFSFVDDVGVVSHPPAATLDFPLSQDPQTYKQYQRHNFAAQVDEGMLAAAAADVTPKVAAATPFTRNSQGSAVAADPTAAAAAADGLGGDAKSIDVEEGGVAAATSRHSSTTQLPTRSTPSGCMELSPLDPVVAVKSRLSVKEAVLRTMPIWLTVLLLLLTRIPALPIKRVLQSTTPRFLWHLGTFGKFGISASLVVQLREILSDPTVHWKYELLYVPFLIPFALASAVTVLVHRKDMEVPWHTPFREAFQRVAGITVATVGALILVQLIRVGAAGSPAYIIGYFLSSWLAQGFLAISAFLGALGSFFSGSTTVSNLTFGDIQKVAAERIGSSTTGMLAVQVAGATAGNAVCINNILSAKAVMNMAHVPEGEFIRRTAPVVLLFLLLAQAIGLIFTLGNVLPDKPLLSVF